MNAIIDAIWFGFVVTASVLALWAASDLLRLVEGLLNGHAK